MKNYGNWEPTVNPHSVKFPRFPKTSKDLPEGAAPKAKQDLLATEIKKYTSGEIKST
jgi:hypothetical protein